MTTSFQAEWDAAARSRPVADSWIEGLLAHRDEGPIGEPAARDLLREVMRLRVSLCRDKTGLCDSTGECVSCHAVQGEACRGVKINPQVGNACLHTFRTTGKWYASGRASISADIFSSYFTHAARRQKILEENAGKCPGLSTRGEDFVWVVLLDDVASHGYPLMLRPC